MDSFLTKLLEYGITGAFLAIILVAYFRKDKEVSELQEKRVKDVSEINEKWIILSMELKNTLNTLITMLKKE